MSKSKKLNEELFLFSGNANPDLSAKIAQEMKIPLGHCRVGRFPDGEVSVKIEQNVRGSDVFIIQSTCPPVNENIMELLVLIDAFKRASAGRITTVIPYYGYARQDRKDQPRVPISAKLVADVLTVAGSDRVLTMDLHAGQIQGFFSIPVDNLTAAPIFLDYFRKKKLDNLLVISPDVGGIKMARNFSRELGSGMAVVAKHRTGDDSVEVEYIIGDVKGKNVIIIDDQINTAGTIAVACRSLKEGGARDVFVAATHAIFAGQAVERLSSAPISEIVITDTIPTPRADELKNLIILSVAHELAEAIDCIHNNQSVSALFRGALF
jgi:ribose-phosphate pyrophosphokinase